MAELKYEVIISDEAKRLLGKHIRFVAQVNKAAAAKERDELMKAIRSLEYMWNMYSIAGRITVGS